MNKLPIKKYNKLFSILISIILILIVLISCITFFTARILLYKDIFDQRAYLDYIKLNPPMPVDEHTFCNFDFSINPKITQLQYLSTHNSYKKKMPSLLYGVAKTYSNAASINMHQQYHHSTLTNQLNNGIRGLELDVRYQFDNFYVYHIPVTDGRTNNPIWKTTLEELLLWSVRNPDHTMINIIIEMKNDSRLFNPSYKKLNQELLNEFDKTIAYTLGHNKIVTPNILMNGYDNLQQMVEENGWPTFHQTAGKFMFLLHYHEEYTDQYISIDPTLSTQIMTPMIESKYLDKYIEYAAVLLHNTPEIDVISELIQNNYLVRTRMDINIIHDTKRASDAILSGAQIITTDLEKSRILPLTDYNAYLEDSYTVILNKVNT